MKKPIIICIISIVSLLTSCGVESNTNRSYFASGEKRCIILPVKVNDSICADMLFDTGTSLGILTLDSTFCAENSLFEDAGDRGRRVSFSLNTWAGHLKKYRRSRMAYNYPLTMDIGESTIRFDKIFVQDTKRDFAVSVDGLVGFSENDTSHIWELNFGNDYMELHPASDFKMPDNCYVLPFSFNGPWKDFPHVKFPIKIKNSAGDTVTVEENYLIDTGLTQDIVLMNNAKSIGFFDHVDDVVLVTCAAGYRSRYIVSAKVFDRIEIDSLRIYTDSVAKLMIDAGYTGILGLNFLKRFNLFFDFKNMQLGFQPTGKKFERGIDPNVRKFYYSASLTEDQKYIITMIADIKDNPFKEAGFLVGDEIVALDGVDIQDWLSGKHKREEKENNAVRVLDIIRNGENLTLTYQRNDEGWGGE